nr:MAG TPA: hypothetical protein [Caudoviricetes sp.]
MSDYRRANPAPKFFQTFQKLFKNPIRIFSKPFEKSSGFSARQVRGCRGGAVSARAARQAWRRQAAPRAGAIWQRSGCVACGAGSRRRAAGLRVWQSGGPPLLPCHCCCGQSL